MDYIITIRVRDTFGGEGQEIAYLSETVENRFAPELIGFKVIDYDIFEESPSTIEQATG